MPNTLNTSTLVAFETLDSFMNNCVCYGIFDNRTTDFTSTSGYRPGTSVTIPKPARYTVENRQDPTLQLVTEGSCTLTLDQTPSQLVSFGTTEFAVSTHGNRLSPAFKKRYIDPMAAAMASYFDSALLSKLMLGATNIVGASATELTSLLTVGAARAAIVSNGAPATANLENMALILSPFANNQISGTNVSLTNPTMDISRAYKTGMTRQAMGFTWYESNLIPSQTVGALGGVPVVDGASQTGASLVTKSWTSGVTNVVKAGDMFTISGVNRVNPISFTSTGVPQQFTILANANSGASTGPATLSISPSIIVTGPTQNVSASPADNAPLTMLTGAAAVTNVQNIAAHNQALSFAVVPVSNQQNKPGADSATVTDPDSGISITVSSQYAIATGVTYVRAEMLFGSVVGRPEWACRVMSKT